MKKEITFFDNPDTITPTAPVELKTSSMSIQLETITPEAAQALLDGNTDNRPARERHIKFLADQMIAGGWQVTGDPIKIGKTGRLLDGQHRLMAIVRCGIAQNVFVARNCEEEIFAVLDTGKNRTAADVLATAGMKNHTTTAATAKILLMHEQDRLGVINKGSVRQVTNSIIHEFTQTHDLEKSVTCAQAWVKRCRLLNAGEWAALHYLFQKVDPEYAYEFLQQISTGLKLTEMHPVYVLRIKLQAARDGRFNFTPAERMALAIKAWNAIREGKTLGVLTWRTSEGFPEIV